MRRRLSGAGGVAFLQAIVVSALTVLSGPGFGQGDAERGRLKADTCMGCHGIPGYTNMYPTYRVPKLGGQHADYIVSALQAYKSGQRDHDTMRAQASTLSTKDMEDIAAYFESLGPDLKAASVATGASGGQQQAAAAKTGGASAKDATSMGEQTYTTVCSTCHDSGTAGAPMISDRGAWQARIAQGKQTLYQHAISGFGAMPPKGGDPSLSNAQVQAAVDYIVAQVGGGAPEQPAAAQAQPAAGKQARAAPAIHATSTPEGKSTYQIMCANCHDAGALGAPMITDPAAWQARLVKGKQALYGSAMSGIGAMPPKGGHPLLSDNEIKAAVDHIIATVSGSSGGGSASKTSQGAGKSAKQSQSGQATKGEAR